MGRPSDRIAVIRAHIVRCKYLDGADASFAAMQIYLDEQAGFKIPRNHPLRLAEVALGVLPLLPEDTGD
jgi:hypothetical protein